MIVRPTHWDYFSGFAILKTSYFLASIEPHFMEPNSGASIPELCRHLTNHVLRRHPASHVMCRYPTNHVLSEIDIFNQRRTELFLGFNRIAMRESQTDINPRNVQVRNVCVFYLNLS